MNINMNKNMNKHMNRNMNKNMNMNHDKAAPHHSIIFQNYPLIEKHFNLVKNIPNIAKWLSARPVTSM